MEQRTLKDIIDRYKYITICDSFEFLPDEAENEEDKQYHLSIENGKDYLVEKLPKKYSLNSRVLDYDEETKDTQNDWVIVVLGKKN
jgi:hypothetical protein